MFSELALTIVAAALVNNVVLTGFLGLCPFFGSSGKFESAIGLGAATVFVLTLTTGLCYLLDAYVLRPWALEGLRIVSFIVVIAAVVRLTDRIIYFADPLLHRLLGLFLPLITTNCAVLGVALLNARAPEGLFQALVFGLGSALGFAVVLIVFAAIRERLEAADVPTAFRGAPIAMVTAGMMAMAFMGFAGLA